MPLHFRIQWIPLKNSKGSLKIFERPALEALYALLTSEDGAKMCFMKPHQISTEDWCQTCLVIQTGATAAIHSVRQEFKHKVDINSTQEYINSLGDRPNNTHLLISVKGFHHPLNAGTVPKSTKGVSLIKVACLYAETLQGDSKLTGGQPMSSMKKAHSKMLGSHWWWRCYRRVWGSFLALLKNRWNRIRRKKCSPAPPEILASQSSRLMSMCQTSNLASGTWANQCTTTSRRARLFFCHHRDFLPCIPCGSSSCPGQGMSPIPILTLLSLGISFIKW